MYGKQSNCKKETLEFYTRSLNETKFNRINECLSNVDWSYLSPLETNEACHEFTQKITETLDNIAPLKKKTIFPKQQIQNPWMTSGLIKSSKTLDHLYREQIGNFVSPIH